MSTFRSSRVPRRFLTIALALFCVPERAVAQDGIPCPAEPTTMAVSYGDAVTCAHQVPGDNDTFTFTGTSGEVVVISALPACVTLTAPGGASVDACGGLRNRLDAVLSQTGTYTLTTRSGTVGPYTLALERLIPASSTARALQYGDTVVDQMNVAGDLDLFWFNGGANDTISVLASTSENMPPCIELVAPDSARSTACGFGPSHQIQITLLQSGPYAVLVRQGDTIGFTHAWSYSVQLLCAAGSCQTAPMPPTGLTGTVSAFATTLTWNAPASGRLPTSYVIEAGTTSGASNVAVFDTLSTSTMFLAPGIPNGTYFVRVKSRNQVGTSLASNEIVITGTPGCPLPAAPASFTATASGLFVSLQWATVSNGPSYVLDAGSSSGASDIVSLDVGAVTQLATSAPPNRYFLRVRARNACGIGPASPEVVLVVGCAGPPAPPANLTVTLSGRRVVLGWPAASGEPAGYSIEAGSASGASDLANVDVGNQLTFAADAPPGTYFVRVRARNPCGTSGPSVERTVVVP